MLCGHDEPAELRPSTLEPGKLVCSDLDACYGRTLNVLSTTCRRQRSLTTASRADRSLRRFPPLVQSSIRDCERRPAELRKESGPDVEAERLQLEERRRIAVAALDKALEDLGGLPSDEFDPSA
jgi:hypothetical protein